MHPNNRKFRLGIIGCGAIVSQFYLPIIKDIDVFKLAVLVDNNELLLKKVGQKYKASYYFNDYKDCYEKIDAAIVALPHYLHAPVSIDLLQRGIHVFCEKPMATEYGQCEKMLEAARSATLTISDVRRFYWSSREVKRMIESNYLGRLLSIAWEEGAPFEWPTASGFFFDRKQAGGGVTMDRGCYIFNMLSWWTNQYPKIISYKDDNFGGVEAESIIDINFPDDLQATIRLSRLEPLKNECRLEFEKGKIIYSIEGFNRIQLLNNDGSLFRDSPVKKNLKSYFYEMLQEFGRAISENSNKFTNSKESAETVKLIGECYRSKKEIIRPWLVTN